MLSKAYRVALQLLEKEKAAGAVSKTLKEGVRGYLDIGKRMADAAVDAGVKSPAALAALKYAPHAAAVAGAKKAYDSPTGQRMRFKVHQMRARRQQSRGY